MYFNATHPYKIPERNAHGYYESLTGYNYSFVFAYETKFFNHEYMEAEKRWMTSHWLMSFFYTFLYWVAIFLAQKYMEKREKFELRRALIAWNFTLAGFSALGAIRVWPEFIHVVQKYGIQHSYCSKDWQYGVTGGWGGLFIISKFPELIDTVFIVARKQKLIFLHWYHHATVLLYAWFSCRDFAASGRWFVIMNYSVHAVMYTYYGCRALRFSIPKWVNILITSSQLLQMVFGVYINVSAYIIRENGGECDISYDNMKWSFLMYFTYFLLFFNFFYKTYLVRGKKQRVDAAASKVPKKTN